MMQDRRARLGVGLVALMVLAAAPRVLNFNLQLMDASNKAVLYAFVVLSVVILTGYVGQFSLCQATFMGLSAFTTASLANHGMNYFAAALIGIVLSFVLGVLVGIPALRLSGILLAVVTAGLALSFDSFFYQDVSLSEFNGGLSGWTIQGADLFGVKIEALTPGGLLHIYWGVLAIFALVCVLVVNLHDSGSGRRFRAIRDSELAAATMGVDLTRYKLLAFGLAAGIAGIGGAFYPLVQGSVTQQPFSFFYSLQIAAVAVLMGIRFIPAAALGGFFISFVPTLLPKLQDFLTSTLNRPVEIPGAVFQLVLGVLLVIQVIQYPDGVWGDLAHRIRHIFGGNEGAKASPGAAV
ncbi:MAG: branched-chain amino acid ABC transporter permease [Candidatus Dormibacteria bacterium]